MTREEELLAQYVRERSEPAFRELVSGHIDLVYSTALRAVNGDSHMAQDVTQTVFIDLARKAWRLPGNVVLAAWLHRHTRFTAATAIRAERRRRTREQTAMEMTTLDKNLEPLWDQIAPHLDECLNQLNPSDRDAIVLRFLNRQDFRALGSTLGISEDAAQKRVSRALDKLRGFLKRRGVTVTGVALTSVLVTEAVTAAPAGLAGGVTAAALNAAASASATLTTLKLMASAKLKIGIAGAVIIASVVTPLVIQHQVQAKLSNQEEALRQNVHQLAQLQADNLRLSNLLATASGPQTLPDEQYIELLKLRGEIARLNAWAQELKASKINEPLSREEALDSLRQMYLDRVNHLKQLFAANPAAAVPELQYLTDAAWLDLVGYDINPIDRDDRQALSGARSEAQLEFSSMLHEAVLAYGKNNNGQFPTALSQLGPYFKFPVDDSVLQDWTILPTSSLASEIKVGGDWAITQKAPVDAELDQAVAVGLMETHLGMHGTNQWVRNP